MSKFCRFCGTSIDDDALYCASCGKEQLVEEANNKTPNNMANSTLGYISNSVSTQRKRKILFKLQPSLLQY